MRLQVAENPGKQLGKASGEIWGRPGVCDVPASRLGGDQKMSGYIYLFKRRCKSQYLDKFNSMADIQILIYPSYISIDPYKTKCVYL